MNKLRLPLGEDIFGEYIARKLDFVDKTLFIKERLDDVNKVAVITRPRRFGKTSALTMLHYFLAPEVIGQSTKGMFDNLKIAKLGNAYMQHQGKYPVIFISLKEIGKSTFEETLESLVELFVSLYDSHHYLLDSPHLTESQKSTYQLIVSRNASQALLEKSLFFLTECLYIHFGVKPWLLLDEYDSPLHKAYATSNKIAADNTSNADYFDRIVDFMRSMLGSLLKTNPYLDRAVLTGILRISRESMFSGLNNVKVYSILDEKYAEYFGFTQAEVDDLLKRSGFAAHCDQVKAWYNGYQFGNQTLYNPWSIANFIDDGGKFKTYWVNTSGNQLVHSLLKSAPLDFKIDFEHLLNGTSLEKNVNENLVFRYLHQDIQAIWSLLLFTGYLKPITIKETATNIACQMMIPNQEVRQLYQQIIAEWLVDGDPIESYGKFIDNLLIGDMPQFEHYLARILLHIVSYHDFATEPEAFYHGLMLGFTASLIDTYEVQSNRESGLGRFDIILLPKESQKLAIVIELKVAANQKQLGKAAIQALAQIEKRQYQALMTQKGYSHILKIGIGFWGKECVLRSARTA